MKRFSGIGIFLLAIVLLVVFTGNINAQDKKVAKKQEVKVQKTEKQECSKKCQGEHAEGKCKGHEHKEGEKHECDHKQASKDCQGKTTKCCDKTKVDKVKKVLKKEKK